MTESDYTAQANAEIDKYIASHRSDFNAPAIAMAGNDATFTAADLSIEEAAQLISEARRQMKLERERNTQSKQSQEAVAQERDDVSKLPDREAERVRAEWAKEAAESAERYADARNRGSQP